MRPCRESIAKLETIYESTQLRLLSFYLSEVHLSQLGCTPTAVATLKMPTSRAILRWIIPTDMLLVRSTPTELDNTTNKPIYGGGSAYERSTQLSGTSAPMKCTYGETYPTIDAQLQCTVCPPVKGTIAGIHCAVWSAFMVKTYTIPQTDHDDFSEHTYYGHSKSTYHINEFRLQ
jgi:hypothetical protein